MTSTLLLIGGLAVGAWLLFGDQLKGDGDLVIPRPGPTPPTDRSTKASRLTRALCDLRDSLAAVGRPEAFPPVQASVGPILLEVIGQDD